MKNVFIALATTVVLAVALFSQATATSGNNVYCANGKIEIDMRSLEQMKSARGSNVCLLKEFAYRTDAEKFAKNFGGVGGSCSCK